MCKHDINWLMGTADGVVCRKCGKVFPSLATLRDDLEADRAGSQAPAPAKEEKPAKAKKKKEDA